ncbi:MAG TPA: hypothetical protein VFM71_04850 [Gemmatimonadaceae bacterium]|nr:hypothetical protein [Gemmatimonadaceae bacterium]
MPIPLTTNAPTLFIRREAFERSGITRQSIDEWLNLTADEFQVEGALIAIGPIYEDEGLQALIAALEEKGLTYFDDFFEMSGNWPDWIRFVAVAAR